MLALLLATLARHVRLGALAVAIAVIGAGSATAAMVTVSDASGTATVPAVAPVVVPPVVFDQEACDAARNHGAYVSFVADATKGLADRGAVVSAAAQSDCGKTKKKKDAAEKQAAKTAKQAAKTAKKAAQQAAKGAKVKPSRN